MSTQDPGIRRIGILSPGAMGAALGRSWTAEGLSALVALDGRSARSKHRATTAGLEDVGRLDRLVGRVDLIISVVPPAFALDVAMRLAEVLRNHEHHITVIDANAVSPERARAVRRTVEDAGARYVDGGIVGAPPTPGATTTLVLSGVGADTLAPVLSTDEIATMAIGGDAEAASTLKMCHAAWTKGTSALLIAIRAVSARAGVDDALVELWQRVQPAVLARSDSAAVAARAWRWSDEMREIARTFEGAGVPGGAASAAALLYDRLAKFKDIETATLSEVIEAVIAGDRPGSATGGR